MTDKEMNRIQRGQAITFRLPSDTPDHIIKRLQKLKKSERRNFSSKIAEFVLQGVGNSLSQERETINIPLPKPLSNEQRNWLKHSHSEALLGSLVYQLLIDPIRATSVLASLNSGALDIDEALYLQEEEPFASNESYVEKELYPSLDRKIEESKEYPVSNHLEHGEDDLMNFDLDSVRQELASPSEKDQGVVEVESAEDLLGDFLAKMNS
ncbi:hypothetical protein [Bacillus sp. Marseille-P3661]|uniref:hypothetical protein n=1 Tax=Bacillus sp. Marseille-P3661 TaxID=1936234 RepID=UPI000C857580|nr:hypothetical protein [Bacillus sp. Marseille-P3661]